MGCGRQAEGRSERTEVVGIYQRQGWYWARKTIKGVEYRDPLGTQSKREAENAYSAWVTGLLEKTSKGEPGHETSFSVAVDNFTENHFPTLKESSRVRYLQSLLTLTPYFEGKTLQSIGKADISKFVSERRKKGGSKKGSEKQRSLSDATIIRDLQCLSSVFTVAADFELCEANPVAAYLRAHKRRKTLVNSKPRERYLSHPEELLVLNAALARAADPTAIRRKEKATIAAALALYVDTGMRAQELLNCNRKTWINLARNEITIPGDYSKSGEPRTIPILPRARRIIEMLPTNKHTDLLLWRCASGKKFADLNKTFQNIAASVGITGVEIHDLRRTCGCRLLQDHRMRMAEVSNWLGHASVEVTETVYAFLSVEDLHDAIGGRVHDKAARLQLEEMFQMQFDTIVGTKDGTKHLLAIEKKGKRA